MKLKLKKISNLLYIIDVEAEIKEGDLFLDKSFGISKARWNTYEPSPKTQWKVIATPDQIDIDNIFEKWLEALAEKYAVDYFGKKYLLRSDVNRELLWKIKSVKDSYFQAKKETPFSEIEIKNAFIQGKFEGINMLMNEDKEYIQQLKASKIPECEVELEMENYCGSPLTTERCPKCIDICDRAYLKPKFAEGKVTVTKILL